MDLESCIDELAHRTTGGDRSGVVAALIRAVPLSADVRSLCIAVCEANDRNGVWSDADSAAEGLDPISDPDLIGYVSRAVADC